MDGDRFDLLVRMVGASRRSALRVAVLAALAGSLPGLGPVRVAAACRRSREACKRGSQCCSGVCKGKRAERECRRAPHQGSCTIERDACRQGVAAECGDPGSSCYCFLTAEGASFCGRGNSVSSCAECESQFPGRFCLPGSGPQCGAFSCVEPCTG
jgi:hypothetical protein